MTTHLAEIWRYPIKSHSRESLEQVQLEAGKSLPWDRHWAVAHTQSKADGKKWAPCVNFNRGAKAPSLMAISAKFDETRKEITLYHPDNGTFSFYPDQNSDAFLAWSHDLIPPERAASARLVQVFGCALTDTNYPSISLLNTASGLDLAERMGCDIDMRRWRGNFILNGLSPWQEFNLIGQKIQLGTAILDICEPIKRCLATTANPDNGLRDCDTLKGLKKHYGHQNFGIYARVAASGTVRLGDRATLI